MFAWNYRCDPRSATRGPASARLGRAPPGDSPRRSTGATGSFEFESASGVDTELQCGSYIFMDADYGRNLDHDGAPTKAFEPSLFVWATVMNRPAEDHANVDAGPQGPRCLDCFSMITICR